MPQTLESDIDCCNFDASIKSYSTFSSSTLKNSGKHEMLGVALEDG